MKRNFINFQLILLFSILLLITSVSAVEFDDNNLTTVNNIDNFSVFEKGSFNELSHKINETEENQTLTLTEDYHYISGDRHGIVISKSITIDGAGHTLDGNHSSRIFNITAGNVVLKNINFINGNALGRYFSSEIGGGAIYWMGVNGHLQNCNFTNNSGQYIEDDPFENDETITNDDGTVIHLIKVRPMGARVNEGGAISWIGENGFLSNCIFINNNVGYPNGGGAICWRGANGKIINSIFLDNGAWVGSAVEWRADNGLIESSKFKNRGISDNGIFWAGKNGVIKNSFLISPDDRNVINSASNDLLVDFNYWGDTIDNPNQFLKPENVNYWYVSKTSIPFEELQIDGSFILVKVIEKPISKIISKNLKVYFNSKTKFRIQVFDKTGYPAVYKGVTFTVNNHEYPVVTDEKGYATLKIKLNPGKYTIFSQYGEVIVKNRITVKSTLITKNLSKKVKKSAKFKIKVLNSNGKTFKKQLVKIKFKGKIYKLKTNNKGIATFKIPKNLKIGKYTIKTTYNGLTNSNKIIVKK